MSVARSSIAWPEDLLFSPPADDSRGRVNRMLFSSCTPHHTLLIHVYCATFHFYQAQYKVYRQNDLLISLHLNNELLNILALVILSFNTLSMILYCILSKVNEPCVTMDSKPKFCALINTIVAKAYRTRWTILNVFCTQSMSLTLHCYNMYQDQYLSMNIILWFSIFKRSFTNKIIQSVECALQSTVECTSYWRPSYIRPFKEMRLYSDLISAHQPFHTMCKWFFVRSNTVTGSIKISKVFCIQ